MVDLNYERSGQGPAVLLLHPIGLDLTCWDDGAEAMKGAPRMCHIEQPARFAALVRTFLADARA